VLTGKDGVPGPVKIGYQGKQGDQGPAGKNEELLALVCVFLFFLGIL